MKTVQLVATWLVIIGGVNWGLVGLGNLFGGANWNVVAVLLGPLGLADIVYVVVGLSAVWMAYGKLTK